MGGTSTGKARIVLEGANRPTTPAADSAATGVLIQGYLAYRATLAERGPLWLSESRRNHAQPLTLWTWSKVIRRIALAASVPQFRDRDVYRVAAAPISRNRWLHRLPT